MMGKNQDSFTKWQKITLKHFGYVANLFLALATGLLAFQSTLLVERKFTACCAFGFAMASLIFLTVSIGFAIGCSINRLRDFRLTAQIARKREEGETDLQRLRDESKSIGKVTWRLF